MRRRSARRSEAYAQRCRERLLSRPVEKRALGGTSGPRANSPTFDPYGRRPQSCFLMQNDDTYARRWGEPGSISPRPTLELWATARGLHRRTRLTRSSSTLLPASSRQAPGGLVSKVQTPKTAHIVKARTRMSSKNRKQAVMLAKLAKIVLAICERRRSRRLGVPRAQTPFFYWTNARRRCRLFWRNEQRRSPKALL